MTRRYILGIDAGGSKCHAMLARDDGQVLGWGESDQRGAVEERHRIFGGRGRTYHSMMKAVVGALGNKNYDELHIVSVNNLLPLDFLSRPRPTKIQLHRTYEYQAAFAQAGVSVGVVALAGTGAVVYAKTRDGRAVYLDALGPLLGDHGGGYEIGLRAIRAAAKAGWHGRHRTAFTSAVCQACGGQANDQRGLSLSSYMIMQKDRSEIAKLAKIVNNAANAGDPIARQILHEAAAGIAGTVYDAVDNLKIAGDAYALIGTGSIMTHCTIYWTHFCELVSQFAPRLRPVRSDLPAIVGVTLSAMEHLPNIDYKAAKRKLFQTTRALLKERHKQA